jgi:hypothetical protein
LDPGRGINNLLPASLYSTLHGLFPILVRHIIKGWEVVASNNYRPKTEEGPDSDSQSPLQDEIPRD